jgi:hypothetical protein
MRLLGVQACGPVDVWAEEKIKSVVSRLRSLTRAGGCSTQLFAAAADAKGCGTRKFDLGATNNFKSNLRAQAWSGQASE